MLLDLNGALGMVGAGTPWSSVAVTEAAWTPLDCSQHLLSIEFPFSSEGESVTFQIGE